MNKNSAELEKLFALLSSGDTHAFFKIYMIEVTRVPLLTEEEELNAALAAQQGDQAARNRLVLANLRWAAKLALAKSRKFPHFPLLDFVQEGNLGLFHAIKKFTPKKGRFTTYAKWWINQYMSRAYMEQARLIRLPVYRLEEFYYINRGRRKYLEEFGKEPNNEELSAFLNISVELIEELDMEAGSAPVSLQTPIGEQDDHELEEVVEDPGEDPSEITDLLLLQEDIATALQVLTPRERTVLILMFGLENQDEHGYADIAKKMKISREAVRQIYVRAMLKLRQPTILESLKDYLE